MSQFFQELKRRKVLKTLGVYGAAAIVISQLAASVFPFLYLPDWTVTLVIVLVILGFPITFFLSWTYDLKRENKTDDASGHEDINTDKKWSLTKKILFPVTGFILMVIGGIFWVWIPIFGINEVPSNNTIIGGFLIFMSIIYYSLVIKNNKRFIGLT